MSSPLERIRQAISSAKSVDDIARLEKALDGGDLDAVRDLLVDEPRLSPLANLWDSTKEQPLLETLEPKRVAVAAPPQSRKTTREIHEEEMAKKRFMESHELMKIVCGKLVQESMGLPKESVGLSHQPGPESDDWIASVPEKASEKKKVLVVGCSTAMCMQDEMYLPEVLLRLVVCDFLTDRVILDVDVGLPSDDCDPVDLRPSLTGIEQLSDIGVPFLEARRKFLELVSSETVLVTYNVRQCCRALRLHHSKWVSIESLFRVDPVLRQNGEGKFYIRQNLSVPQLLQSYLGEAAVERFNTIADARDIILETVLGCNRIIKAFARECLGTTTVAIPYNIPPPRTYNTICVSHIPADWSAEELSLLFPAAASVSPVNFFLDVQSNTWRGESHVTFSNQEILHEQFTKLTACTDVFVGWEWIACGKVSQESIREMASEYGPIVTVRVQEKFLNEKSVIPGKEESRPFGFVSFAKFKDAQAMVGEKESRQIVKADVSYHVKLSKKPISAFKRVPLGDGEDYLEAFIM